MGRLVWIEFGRSVELEQPNWLGVDKNKLVIVAERVSWAWHVMLPWLVRKGMSESAARGLLGKVAKHVPRNLVVGWCEGIVKTDPLEPAAYIAAALKVYIEPAKVRDRSQDTQAALEFDDSRETWERSMQALDPTWKPVEMVDVRAVIARLRGKLEPPAS